VYAYVGNCKVFTQSLSGYVRYWFTSQVIVEISREKTLRKNYSLCVSNVGAHLIWCSP